MLKKENVHIYISIALKSFIAILAVLSVIRQEYFLAFASIFVLLLAFIPTIVSRSFKIHLPAEIDLILTVILYLHYVLGEYGDFYYRLSWWDLFLHSGNSIILGLVGFTLAYALLMTSRITAKPFFVSMFSLSFAVLIGAVWEIFEFFMDQAFGFNMQKSGLVDTMTDLMADVVGALLVSVLGFFYIKNPRPGFMHFIAVRYANAKRRITNVKKRLV